MHASSQSPRPAPLGDTALYVLCQAVGWSALGALYFVLDQPGVEAFGRMTFVCGTGLAATHVLYLMARRGAWLDRPVGAWLPRFVGATVAVGLLWWFVVDVAFNMVDSGEGFVEAARSTLVGDLFGLNRITALLHLFVVALWSALFVAAHAFHRYRAVEVVAWQRAAEVREAELRALHAQLNPHFLFNALNSLRALIAEHPEEAQDATTRLARLLRYTLRTSRVETVALAAELEAVRDYLALEGLRLDDRLHVAWEVPRGVEDVRVPPLLVLTLVENAVKHGVAPRPEGGVVGLAVAVDAGVLDVRVTNPGAFAPGPPESGYGLRNVQERLGLLFGDAAGVQVGDRGGLVEARVCLPSSVRPDAPAPGASASGVPGRAYALTR